jgi:hypothetical protein
VEPECLKLIKVGTTDVTTAMRRMRKTQNGRMKNEITIREEAL